MSEGRTSDKGGPPGAAMARSRACLTRLTIDTGQIGYRTTGIDPLLPFLVGPGTEGRRRL